MVNWSGPLTRGKPFVLVVFDGRGRTEEEIGWDRWGDTLSVEWAADRQAARAAPPSMDLRGINQPDSAPVRPPMEEDPR